MVVHHTQADGFCQFSECKFLWNSWKQFHIFILFDYIVSVDSRVPWLLVFFDQPPVQALKEVQDIPVWPVGPEWKCIASSGMIWMIFGISINIFTFKKHIFFSPRFDWLQFLLASLHPTKRETWSGCYDTVFQIVFRCQKFQELLRLGHPLGQDCFTGCSCSTDCDPRDAPLYCPTTKKLNLGKVSASC